MSISTAIQRFQGFSSRGVACLAACALASAGCVDNDTSLTVEGVLAAQAPQCTFTPDPGSIQLFSGALDVALNPTYSAVVLVGNQLTPSSNKVELRSEAQAIVLEGAEVRVTDRTGREVGSPYTVEFGGFVRPSDSEAPGYGLAYVELLRRSDLSESDIERIESGNPKSYVSRVRVFGTTLGGLEVTSSEYSFPIEVCYGCLISYPVEALIVDADDTVVCGDTASDVEADPPCTIGQDAFVDCRYCAGSDDVCYYRP